MDATDNIHETTPIEVKSGIFADVDCGAVWLVNWLNSFPSIKTYWSCQGWWGDPPGSFPQCSAYCSFGCDSQEDLVKVLDVICGFIYATGAIHQDKDGSSVANVVIQFSWLLDHDYCYNIWFEDEETFDRFKEWLTR